MQHEIPTTTHDGAQPDHGTKLVSQMDQFSNRLQTAVQSTHQNSSHKSIKSCQWHEVLGQYLLGLASVTPAMPLYGMHPAGDDLWKPCLVVTEEAPLEEAQANAEQGLLLDLHSFQNNPHNSHGDQHSCPTNTPSPQLFALMNSNPMCTK